MGLPVRQHALCGNYEIEQHIRVSHVDRGQHLSCGTETGVRVSRGNEI